MNVKFFRLVSFNTLVFLFQFFTNSLVAQSNPGTGNPEFNAALQRYVDNLMVKFGQESIDDERFIVQQIRMVNDEIRSRVTNYKEIRNTYFDRLDTRLQEIQALQTRLSAMGNHSLDGFISELESKIEQTKDSGVIDFKRQKVIEDAIQLLFIAEEIIQLDPNASMNQNPKISQGMKESRSKFVQSFGGKVAAKSATDSDADATIFDLYKEWKLTERLKYQVRWTDLQIIKNRMLKNGTQVDALRMLNRELEKAAEAYNYSMFDLAERSFDEIFKRYKNIGVLDDCLYYQAESNYFLSRYSTAKKLYRNLIENYSSSPFIPYSYKRMMYIEYHSQNYNSVIDLFRQMQIIVSTTDPNLDEARFLTVVSSLKAGLYQETIDHCLETNNTSTYFLNTQLILAEAYAGSHNLNQAEIILNKLTDLPDQSPELRFKLLLKLGYINYEQGEYFKAIETFNLIPSNFSEMDKVLIGYAWSFYKIEINKPIMDLKDFSTARKHLELLLDVYYTSDYYLEAKTLLGYIYQLEEKPLAAIDQFDYAFRSKAVKQISDDMNTEQVKLLEISNTADKVMNKALEEKNTQTYERAKAVKEKIRIPIRNLAFADLSSSGIATSSEVKKLKAQLDELERLKSIAKQQENSELVKRIERMQLRIYRAINESDISSDSEIGINYFDEHPFARRQSVVENENAKIQAMRQDVKNQRLELVRKMSALDVQILNAKNQRDYKKQIQLELSYNRYDDILKKLDFMETQTFGLSLRQTNIDLDRWSDYGAFGMANVNFAIRNQKNKEIEYMNKQIEEINTFLENRKANIKHTLKLIEDEITLMTRKVREQERLREREELTRQFEESYFDTHDTEQNQNPDTTLPPDIEIEE